MKAQSYLNSEIDFLEAQLRNCAGKSEQQHFDVLQHFLAMERKSKTNVSLDQQDRAIGRKVVGLPGSKVKLTLIKN